MSPVSKSEKPGIGSKPRPCRLSVDRLDDPLSMGGDDTSTHGGTEKVSEPILEDSDLTRSGKPPRMAGERAGSIDTAVVGARRAGAQDGRQEGPAESSTFDRAPFFFQRDAPIYSSTYF